MFPGMINTLIQFIWDMFIKTAAPQYQRMQNMQTPQMVATNAPAAQKPPVVNDLILNANKMVEIPCDFTIQK